MNRRTSWSFAIACGVIVLAAATSWAQAQQGNAPPDKAVAGFIQAMDGPDMTAAKTASLALFRSVQKAAGTAESPRLGDVLADELARDHQVKTKREICGLLGYCSGQKVVDALAAAMDTTDLRDDARRALARIVDRKATDALVAQLAKGDDNQQVAVIDALGRKGDASAIPSLAAQAASKSEAIRKAAWSALADIPSADALPAFTKAVSEGKDPIATAELLDYATTLLDAGLLAPAEKVLKLRSEAGPLSELDKCKMIRDQARLGTRESIDFVLAALDEKNPKVHGAAIDAAAILPGTDVSRLITERMLKAKGQDRFDLLAVLGRRGGQMEDRTVMMMYLAMLDPDDTVKIACIRAMQAAGITSTLPTMVNLVRGSAGPVADAAEQALASIPGENVTAELIAALPQSNPAARTRLLRVLGQRGDAAALATLIRSAADPDVGVRAAAYGAMAAMHSEDAYQTLLDAFEGEPGPDRDAAERAMTALRSDAITARLLGSYFDASDRQKPSLLRVLVPRQLDTIDALLRSEAVSSNEEIRVAAVEGLARRANPAMASALLAAAKAGPAKVTAVAVGGYLQMASAVEAKDKASAGQMYADAFKLSTSDEQMQAILSGLSRVGDAATEGLIDAIVPLMKQQKLQTPAAMAITGMASRMPTTQKDQAVGLLQAAMKASSDRLLQKNAIGSLRGFGVAVDPAREQGFITCWWLVGPFARGGNNGWDTLAPALAQPDPAKPASIEGKDCAWKKDYSPDPQGAIDLIDVFGRSNEVAAFGYAQVDCEQAGETTFKVGSDDGIVVWVNGQKVHGSNTVRVLTPDQDVFKVSLKAGQNDIVVKALQSRDGWSYCLRIVGPDGKPLPLKQRTE
jgi:HEAT repeat protein